MAGLLKEYKLPTKPVLSLVSRKRPALGKLQVLQKGRYLVGDRSMRADRFLQREWFLRKGRACGV